MFNIPPVIVAVVGGLLAIHFLRVYVLPTQTSVRMILTFAFIPARVTHAATLGAVIPGGEAAGIWSFITYAFLHAGWGHVGFNCLWLAAFGSPLAWRFGPVRFLLFSAAGAIAGAALHLALYPTSTIPLVGASAAISAHMAAACRFVFGQGGPFVGFEGRDHRAYRMPAATLMQAITNRQVLIFLGVWFGLNLLFGLWGAGSGLTSGAIAWEAHIGGFVVGLVLFSFFDPVKPAASFRRKPPPDDRWA